MTTVAVIGAGTMGSAVTRRLLKAGLELNVWNRNPRPALMLAAFGATAHDRATEAVESADIVLTWLPTAQAVSEVMVDGQVLDALATRAVWAQMGTIGVDARLGLGLGEDLPADPTSAPLRPPIHRLVSREAEQIAATDWANVS